MRNWKNCSKNLLNWKKKRRRRRRKRKMKMKNWIPPRYSKKSWRTILRKNIQRTPHPKWSPANVMFR
jgi:hypothetical protein